MVKEKFIELEGVVTDVLPDSNFRVDVGQSKLVLAHKSGKIKRYNIRILLGDKVKLQVSPYDLTRGRIVYRC